MVATHGLTHRVVILRLRDFQACGADCSCSVTSSLTCVMSPRMLSRPAHSVQTLAKSALKNTQAECAAGCVQSPLKLTGLRTSGHNGLSMACLNAVLLQHRDRLHQRRENGVGACSADAHVAHAAHDGVQACLPTTTQHWGMTRK